jgi:hypothetical protein
VDGWGRIMVLVSWKHLLLSSWLERCNIPITFFVYSICYWARCLSQAHRWEDHHVVYFMLLYPNLNFMLLYPNLNSLPSWAVILPCEARNLSRPTKLELAIYPELQV